MVSINKQRYGWLVFPLFSNKGKNNGYVGVYLRAHSANRVNAIYAVHRLRLIETIGFCCTYDRHAVYSFLCLLNEKAGFDNIPTSHEKMMFLIPVALWYALPECFKLHLIYHRS